MATYAAPAKDLKKGVESVGIYSCLILSAAQPPRRTPRRIRQSAERVFRPISDLVREVLAGRLQNSPATVVPYVMFQRGILTPKYSSPPSQWSYIAASTR
ncbi:hypothetical protein R1flu_027459 [Riccia fluitans]|uniref:Uncharacterized protein n=1 Tax=Riccia fluitans TaxID=41844 RepID=A0ABD1XIY8_9MARC